MLAECLAALQIDADFGQDAPVFVDGTLGGGGHSAAIASRLPPNGRLLAIDRDPAAVEAASATALAERPAVELQQGSYADLPRFLEVRGWRPASGVLLDLGLSSDQLVDRTRGFGFDAGGALDLRFDPTGGLPASEWIAETSERTLAEVLERYADEPNAGAIARALKSTQPQTTEELVACVDSIGGRTQHHPATRTIQALRVAVNEELRHVERALLESLPLAVRLGGRLAILTFHSTEDRLVKRSLKAARDADGKPVWTAVSKKPILPRPAEVRENPRSRSAKLRVVTRQPM